MALADVPVPRVAVMPTDVPNSFAAGRSVRNATVVFTRGLLDRLTDQELEAVLAHELTHIVNSDAFVMTIAAAPALLGRKVIWGFVSLPSTSESISGKIGTGFLVVYLLPLVFIGWVVYAFATLLVMSISRYREYVADRGAAVLSGAPEELMSALQKIADEVPLIPEQDLRTAAALNAFFVLPAQIETGDSELDPLRMFPTHPPLSRQLARLEGLASELGRPRRSAEAPPPVETAAEALDNPQALGAFVLAALVYGGLAGLLIGGPEDATSLPVWLLLLGPGASALGIVLGLQGVGRAAAGARGMGYAVTALVLLVGPGCS